jgi:hypothetical protein
MSEALILEFSNVVKDQYGDVNEVLGIDVQTGKGDWPVGMLSHTGAASDDAFVVFELWDSKQSQEDFMHTRLGPALAKVGVPEPTRVEWFSVEGHYDS